MCDMAQVVTNLREVEDTLAQLREMLHTDNPLAKIRAIKAQIAALEAENKLLRGGDNGTR